MSFSMRSKFCRNKKKCYICRPNAKVAQLVEHDLPKVGVAGSNPVFRSFLSQ